MVRKLGAGLVVLKKAISNNWGITASVNSKGRNNSSKIICKIVSNTGEYGSRFLQEMYEEGYVLDIGGNGITIMAQNAAGLFYGMMTLVQLIKTNNERNLPNLVITDYPEMKMRGVSDDVSRGQVSSKENFFEIIKYMAEFKLNTYCLYLEHGILQSDDSLTNNGNGVITREEVESIQKYARKYFISVIPIVQSLAHQDYFLSMPENQRYAVFPGSNTIDITNKDAVEYMTSYLDNVVKKFDSEYIHVGCDETYDIGTGRSKLLADSIGLSDIYRDYYSSLFDCIDKNDKKMMMYADMLLKNPELLGMIQKEITLMYWAYHPQLHYPEIDLLIEKGFRTVVSPGLHNWNKV